VSGIHSGAVNRACSCVKRKALPGTWQHTAIKKEQSFKLYQIFHGSEQTHCRFLGYDIVYFVRLGSSFSPMRTNSIFTQEYKDISFVRIVGTNLTKQTRRHNRKL
jgi:hypothetical protein